MDSPAAQATTMEADARQQFAELIEQHRGIVFKIAHAFCRHPDDRADLAQEIAAHAWRAVPRYEPTRSFATWMYRIALNVAISQAGSNGRGDHRGVPLDMSCTTSPPWVSTTKQTSGCTKDWMAAPCLRAQRHIDVLAQFEQE